MFFLFFVCLFLLFLLKFMSCAGSLSFSVHACYLVAETCLKFVIVLSCFYFNCLLLLPSCLFLGFVIFRTSGIKPLISCKNSTGANRVQESKHQCLCPQLIVDGNQLSCRPVIQVIRRWRQDDCYFEATIGNIESLSLVTSPAPSPKQSGSSCH